MHVCVCLVTSHSTGIRKQDCERQTKLPKLKTKEWTWDLTLKHNQHSPNNKEKTGICHQYNYSTLCQKYKLMKYDPQMKSRE